MQFQDTKVKIATRKACNTKNIPPKPKHVRTIIIKSFTGGIPTFITEINKTLQSSNMIQQYKSIDTLQRVLIEGSDEIVIHYLQILLSLFNKIINNPPIFHKNDIFRQINKHYLQYIQLRLIFHQKNPSIHSNLTLPNQQNIPEEYYSDQKCLTTISYCMDLMDYLLVLPLPLIQQFPNDNCKLDCCIPLIQDSFVLYNNIIFFMTNLAHIDQYQSVFKFLYDRLKKLYAKLNQLYSSARQNYYISTLIDIPYLPALPEFKISEEEKKKYLKKHPQSVSKQHPHEMKVKQQEKERKELLTFGRTFNEINQQLIDQLVPSTIQPEDEEYRFVQFVNQFQSQMNSFTNQQIQQALWTIIKESKNILHDENIEFVISNNAKENVINLLYTYQQELNEWQLFGIDNQMKQIELQKVHNQIEEFINSLISYIPQQQNNKSSLLFDWDSINYDFNQNDYQFDFNNNNEFNFESEFENETNEMKEENNSVNNYVNESETKELKENEKHKEKEENNKLMNEIQQINEIIETIQSKQHQSESESNEFIIQFENISKEVIELIKRAEECEKERIENGKEQSPNLYYQNEIWKEGLLSCAKRIVEWIQYISDCIMNDIYDEQLLVALKQFKSLCSQLVSAAKVSMNENSFSLHQLEEITLKLKKKIEQFIKDILSSQQHEQEQVKEKEMKEIKSDGIQSKKHLMESEIKVLQLQRELEHAQQHLYSLRKKEYE